MAKGQVTFKDSIDEKVFDIGKLLEKSLEPGINSVKELGLAFNALKSSALEYSDVEKKFKVSEGRKQFLEAKQEEEIARKKASNAIKLEKESSIALQKVQQSVIDTKKKELELEAKKQRQQKNAIKLNDEEKHDLRLLNKGKREAAVLSSKLSTEYEKQAVILTRLRRKYKDVALVEGETSEKAKKLRAEIQKLDTTLKKVDANVGQFQRSVGNYSKAMSSATQAARSLASAMGVVGGAFLVAQVIRDATRIVRDFEKQNATLSAVLQVEKSEMKALTDEAVRLGATTVKTASEVTQLQIAYARLGFEQKEIIDLTESTISGSIAMNAELDRTANLTGAVVNTFDDLSTTDAPRIIDILSLATAKSALNFEKLETGIPIVAGAANAAGVPFTRLIALMGKLADSGIDVSTSSTALRNIFIESAAQGLNYEEILDKIKNSQDKLTASNDEFGKRAAVSSAILAKNIDTTKELDDALNNAAGTAERMANKELDTLDGSIKLLRSAWEGYILNLNESTEAGDTLKGSISFLAKNLKTIINLAVLSAKIWVGYKAAVLTARLQTKLIGKELSLTAIKSNLAAKGITRASFSWANFNKVLKANALFLTITAIGTLISLTKRYSKSVNALQQAQVSATKATAEERSELERLVKVAKNERLGKEDRENAIKRINAISSEYLGNITLETINTKEASDAIDLYIIKLNEKALAQAVQEKRSALTSELLEKELKSIEDYKSGLENFGDNTIGVLFDKIFGETADITVKNREELEEYLGTLDYGKETVDRLREAYLPYLEAKNKDIEETQKQIDLLDDFQNQKLEEAKKRQEEIEASSALAGAKQKEIRTIELLNDRIKKQKALLGGTSTRDEAKEIQEKIKAYQKEIDAILGVTKVNKDAEKATKEREAAEKKLRQDLFNLESFRLKKSIQVQKEITQNENETFEVRKEAIKEQSNLEVELAELTAKNKFEALKKFSDKEIEVFITKSKLSKETLKNLTDEELLILSQYQAEKKRIQNSKEDTTDSLDVEKLKKDAEKKRLLKEKELNDELRLENDLFTKKEGVYANAENAVELREKRIAEIKKKYALDALNTQVKAVEKLLENEELSAEKRAEYETKLSNIKLQISNLNTESFIDNNDKEVSSTLEKTEKIVEISTNLTFALGDLANAIFDSKIQKIDEEIAREDAKFEKQLENENLTAVQREAIEAEQEQKREELEAKKRKQQRKQAKLNKALAVADAGVATALGVIRALTEVPKFDFGISASLFAGFIAATGAAQIAAILASPIPQFEIGTENAPEGWAMVDEEGAEIHTDKHGNIKSWGSSGGANLRYLEEGDKILNHTTSEDYKNLMRASILAGVEIDNKKLKRHQAEAEFEKQFINEKAIENAIANGFKNQKVHFHTSATAKVDLGHAAWVSNILNRG